MADQPDFGELKRQLRGAADEGHASADAVLGRVDEYLTADDVSDEHREGLIEHLRDAVHHFEADHPRLTAALQQVVDSLTAAGI
jgi:hypothetical protein